MSIIAANLYYGIPLGRGAEVPESTEGSVLDNEDFGWEGEDGPAIFIKESHLSACDGHERVSLPEWNEGWDLALQAYCQRNGLDPKKIGWHLVPWLG